MLSAISEAISKEGTGRLWYRRREKILAIERTDPLTGTSFMRIFTTIFSFHPKKGTRYNCGQCFIL